MSEVIQIFITGDEFSLIPAPSAPGAATVLIGNEVNRPAAGVVGRFYWAQDTRRLFLDTGTTWDVVSVLAHGELTGLSMDHHPLYLPLSGARPMTGPLTLAPVIPSHPQHAVSKEYVDNLIAQSLRWQWGIGFVATAVTAGATFANVPVSSLFSGAILRGWVVTAKSVGTSTTATTIALTRNGAQVDTVSITNTSPTIIERMLSPTVTLNARDVLSCVVLAAPTTGAPSGVGIWVFGTV